MPRNKRLDHGFLSAIILLFLGVIMLFLPYYKLNNKTFGQFKIVIPEYDKLATFISGITAPFLSLAAFILLYLTYKSQRQELADSKIILQQQNSTLQRQQFESTFFNLIDLHNSIVAEIQFIRTRTNYLTSQGYPKLIEKHGRVCFLEFYNNFYSQYKNIKSKKLNIETVTKAYNSFFEEFEYELGHYFRNLYHLIKFVDQSNVMDKQKYISLVRAQLSSYELCLIFYNCLSEYGAKFKPLVIKYHLLKNMNKDLLFDKTHKSFYDESAYGVCSEHHQT